MADATTKTVRDIEIVDEKRKRRQKVKLLLRNLFLYSVWPTFAKIYFVYMKWAKGNDDRTEKTRKLFWICFGIFAAVWAGWWAFIFSGDIFVGDALVNTVYFFLAWFTFSTTMNAVCASNMRIPDYTDFNLGKGRIVNYLKSNERILWNEFPEPMHDKFPLGTDGQKWIMHGWDPPLFERSGTAILGDLGKGRTNAINYMTACAFGRKALCFCLDGKPASGVGFRHLRGLKFVHIADNYEMIIKSVKWIKKIFSQRVKDQSQEIKNLNFPMVFIVCDEEISQTFLPGKYVKSVEKTIYDWAPIHGDLVEILHNGNAVNMHVLAAIEPSNTWLDIHNDNRPYFTEIDFYYSLPRETEEGKLFFTRPHDNPFLDVFSIRVGADRILGKMPFIPESDLRLWIETQSKRAGDAAEKLWIETIVKIPEQTIGEKIERDELIWVGNKLVSVSTLKKGLQTDKIDRGAREENYQKFDAQRNGHGTAHAETVKENESV